MPADLPHLDAIRRGALLGLAACFGAPVVPAAPGTGQAPDLALVVGFSGPVGGQLRLAMPRAVALACARHMLGFMAGTLEGDATKALLDAAALVAGAVANELARDGVLVQLAEPTLGFGAACEYEEALALPYGSLNLGIAVGRVGLVWLEDWLTAVVPGYNPGP
jgi:CheY-specific phosphatase CheX